MPDGGLLVAGSTGYLHAYAARTDAEGDTIWTRQFDSYPSFKRLRRSAWGTILCLTGDAEFQQLALDGSELHSLLGIDQCPQGVWSDVEMRAFDVGPYGRLIGTGWGWYDPPYGGPIHTPWLTGTDTSNLGGWTCDYELTGTLFPPDGAMAIAFEPDSGYVMAMQGGATSGELFGYSGDAGYRSRLWLRSIPTVPNDIVPTINNGCVIAGYSDSHPSATAADDSGYTRWTFADQNIDGAFNSVAATSDGGYVFAGYRSVPDSGLQGYVVRFGPDTSTLAAKRLELEPEILDVSIYPNPFNAAARVTFSLPHAGDVDVNVFDVTGRRVATLLHGRLEAGEHEARFDGSGMASGVYFVRVRAGEVSRVGKMVLMR